MLGLGRDCDIEGAIIDKNASIGRGTVIRPFPEGADIDHELYSVRDGIVVIPKSTVIPPETRISPD
jgi:glucose-1-phosphate adenylyltransferase